MRWSSISFASLRASSTGWTFVRKARPKTPSKSASIFCSSVRRTIAAGESFPPSTSLTRASQRQDATGHPGGGNDRQGGDRGRGEERRREERGAEDGDPPGAAPPREREEDGGCGERECAKGGVRPG